MKTLSSIVLGLLCLNLFAEVRVWAEGSLTSKEAAMQSVVTGPSLGALKRHVPSPLQTPRVAVLSDTALPPGVYTVGRMGWFPTIDSAFSKLSRDGVQGAVTLTLIDTLYQAGRGRRFELGQVAGAGPSARITIRPAVNNRVTIRGDSDAVFRFQNVKYLTLDGRSNPPSPSAGITVHARYNPATLWNDCIEAWGDADRNEFLYLNLKSDDFRTAYPCGGICVALTSLGTDAPDSNLIEGNTVSGVGGATVRGATTARPRNNIIRGNIFGSASDSLLAWVIQSEVCEGTLIEGNVVQFVRQSYTIGSDIWCLGINAYGDLNTVIRNNVVHSMYGSGGAYLHAISGTGTAVSAIGQGLQIYNNMVYNLQNNSTTGRPYVGGIVLWRNNDVLVAYNTVHLSGTGANAGGVAALGLTLQATNVIVRNNVLVNLYEQRAGLFSVALSVGWGAAIFTSDYNDLRVNTQLPLSYTVYYDQAYRTLSDWQASGSDIHSVSELPHFRTPSLHIDSTFGTWLNGHATPVVGITTDFDGQLRHASTPDIGADEFAGFAPTLRRVPSQYATIQAGINASANGDTVLVADGLYYENIRFNGKKIVVASTYLTTNDTSHILNTIINGSRPSNPDSGSVVYFIAGEDTNSVLCGFTITGGTGTNSTFAAVSGAANSGGKKIIDRNAKAASPMLARLRVGGGVYCEAAGARLIRNVIVRNSVVGRIASGGGLAAENTGTTLPYLVLDRNRFADNVAQADSSWAYTGGADVWGYSARIVENVFERDSAIGVTYGVGGGLSFYGTSANGPFPVGLIKGNIFRANMVRASGQGGVGGGAIVEWTAEVLIHENLFDGNVATGLAGWGEAGGLLVDDEQAIFFGRKTVSKNRFINNTASSSTGAYRGGGIYLYYTTATISGNEIANNAATTGSTGGGGGICTYQSAFRIENNIIVRNVSSGFGGAMNIRMAPYVGTEQVVINNTISGNNAQRGGAMDIYGGANVVSLNNILWADTAVINPEINLSGSVVNVHYCDIQGGWSGGTGNINVNPQLRNSTYDLLDASQCIGAGRDSVLIDGVLYRVPSLCFYGGPRPNPAGSRPDIGACENPRGTPLGVSEQLHALPLTFSLEQNYPNPFNPTTTIKYELPSAVHVSLSLYNILGQQIATLVNGVEEPGYKSVQWNASGVASGVYFYRLQAGTFTATKKLLLLR